MTSGKRFAALWVTCLLAMLTVVGLPSTVAAHTDFESSTPADGAAVGEPVGLVTIVFTGEATPVGDEFVALTPAGVVQAPSQVTTVDNRLFNLTFDPPLAGGVVGVRWNVQAADSHPIEGAFSFDVTAPAPTSAPAATAIPTTVAAEQAPADSAATVTPSTDSADAAEEAADDEPALGAAADDVTPTTVAEPAVDVAPDDAETSTLDAFLAVDNSRPGETTATMGRLVSLLGVAVGVGALAFVATALRGTREEIRAALTGVRVAGVAVVVGAVVEYVGVARIAGDSLASAWSSNAGVATTLRIVGGLGLAIGVVATLAPLPRRSLSAAVVTDDAPIVHDEPVLRRWAPDRRSAIAFAAVALLLVSYWFDGHTVSKGIRPLHALVNTVHVAAGAIWVGGVITLAAVVWARHRADRPARALELVVRFSKIATIALVAVILAGGIMAILVLDGFGELTGTQWGKMLLLKIAAVAAAVVAGTYNHFRILPALESNGDDPAVLDRLRSTITAEAILLTFVVMVTAWLVAAAS